MNEYLFIVVSVKLILIIYDNFGRKHFNNYFIWKEKGTLFKQPF